jgi:hypothetical protein
VDSKQISDPKELESDLDELETDGNFMTGVLADRLRHQALQ